MVFKRAVKLPETQQASRLIDMGYGDDTAIVPRKQNSRVTMLTMSQCTGKDNVTHTGILLD